ncbi:flagellar hook-associated protein FlgK [Brenneria populi subsp. brevivirga]|uniref:flagellar hook-associated protein FlgK n=1 Tax=Brenneria populi TaxID=1505588 RepID=UPI002E18B113|nr:flagellar hook-associated protein FlgK [Brenneria populi subsp. brevivirga]
MSNLINTAMSGLKGAQAALSTVSNNISNQAVSGYSRQNVLLSQAVSTSTSAGYIGNGVNVVGINREYNDFIATQLRSAQSQSSSATTYYEQITKIDNLLANRTTGLSATLQDFFTNLQSLTSNPGDSSTRQTVLGKAEGLVNQFKVTDKYLRDTAEGLNTQIQSTVGQINTYSREIADLNNQITRLTGANQDQGNAPNDLLDQRDRLVNELNKLVGVDVSVQDGITYNVSLKNGLSLVQGTRTNDLVAASSNSDPSRITVGYNDRITGVGEVKESAITGGSLSALLTFRSDTLDSVSNQLGQMALSFSDAFNTQHKEGYDRNGEKGEDFFTFGDPVALKNAKNSGSAELAPTYADTSAIKASNYTIKYNGSDWQVTRLSDNATFTASVDASDSSLNFDGLKLAISGTPATNDSFMLKPVEGVITGMSVAITDSSKVAAASVKLDDNGAPVLENGNPVFGGASDNTNANALLALQNKKIVEGKSTITGAYASLIGDIGNQTNTMKVNSTSKASVVTQLTAEQQSISGVNLDEEYGELMRYQQYYQANAAVIQTASTIFDALLSIRA